MTVREGGTLQWPIAHIWRRVLGQLPHSQTLLLLQYFFPFLGILCSPLLFLSFSGWGEQTNGWGSFPKTLCVSFILSYLPHPSQSYLHVCLSSNKRKLISCPSMGGFRGRLAIPSEEHGPSVSAWPCQTLTTAR